MKDNNQEYWKNYFQGVDSDIFEIIDHAIMVAATDHPKEFMLRRGQIAEKLYSCQWTQCCSHEHSVVAVPKKTNNDLSYECACGRAKSMLTSSAGDLKIVLGKQTEVGSCRDDHAEMKISQVRKYTYSEAEALTDELDEENEIIGEVKRIKEILDNSQEEFETVLFESLRRLQFMVVSVEILQATMIGKTVNALRGHRSKQISQLAQILVSGWKIMAKDWLDAAAATVAGSTNPNPSTVVRKGLPSPPMDVGILFATQTPIELSQFFDGIDDDGNLKNNMEYGKNQESGSKPRPESQNYTKQKPRLPNKAAAPSNEKKYQLMLQESVNILTEPSKTESPASQQDHHKPLDDVEIQAKLQATKRKIQDS